MELQVELRKCLLVEGSIIQGWLMRADAAYKPCVIARHNGELIL
jgi:hypothetical protein